MADSTSTKNPSAICFPGFLPWTKLIMHDRWLTVHLHDMIQLDHTSPNVMRKFEEGSFEVQKTQRKFSALAIDHAHTQNNKLVKGRCDK